MSTPIVQFTANNWAMLWNSNYVAARKPAYPPPGRRKHIPLGTVDIPIQATSGLLAATTSSPTAQPHWKFGGSLAQKIATGLTVGGSADAETGRRAGVWLNRINLIFFPQLTGSYSLSFSIPNWHEEISLTIWEYLGPLGDSAEALIQSVRQDLVKIEVTLDRIEGKI